jgi:hypothetical protein
VSLGREPADLVWRRGLDLRVAHCCHEHAGSIFGFLTLELLRVDAELQRRAGTSSSMMSPTAWRFLNLVLVDRRYDR